MKKLSICAILLIGLMIMGGTAQAWNQFDHVKQAPNGKGDLIIVPWYYTFAGGWDTKLTVINTSDTHSAVAKLVVRSYNWSEELIDFLIYLSPNDVWTGNITIKGAQTYIVSEDDSVLWKSPGAVIADADFATASTPMDFPLFPVTCTTNDSTARGYVEIIEAAATNTLTKISGTNRVAKTTIYNWYHNVLTNIGPQDTPNILTGYQEFLNSPTGAYAMLTRAQIYADWNNLTKLDVSVVTGLTEPSRNTIGELEAAIAKSDVALPYINKNGNYSIHVFNFPTKLSWEESTGGSCADSTYNAYNESPYFNSYGTKCEDYTSNIYDLKENTPTTSSLPISGGEIPSDKMCLEVEFIRTDYTNSLYSEGWVRYNWAHTVAAKGFLTKSGVPTANTFTGTPVLPSVMNLRTTSFTQAESAWTDGVVVEGGVTYPYFQYSQYSTP